jgi:amino acid transporter
VSLLRLILGRPLANRESASVKIGLVAGVAAMGLDGLSSSAYGPEAALTQLHPLGAAGPGFIVPVMLLVLALLGILCLSYRQVIEAYPVNGGSYTAAKENLGANAGLLAATALMIDYVLNVAVGISAGVAALVSAVPALAPMTLWLCLGVLGAITLVNLRGTQETGLAFALPTYLFIACFLVVLGLGFGAMALAGGHPHPVVAPPPLPLPRATEGAGLWILMRTFASGCTAMTGVEAVSNGVTAFREPAAERARRALAIIVAVLALLLAGIAGLVYGYGIAAMDQTQPGYQSVLSQLVAAVAGRGAFYYVAIASVLAILCLSANTSFVGFPRLCRLVAMDDYLPRAFAASGRRLVNSVGIVYLAAVAGLLLVAFGGITDRLIPLFAVGAFLAFTMAQAGMAVHWRGHEPKRARGRSGRRLRLAVNAVGAVATGLALLVILAAKFAEGAWIVVLAIPAFFALLRTIKRAYRTEERQLRNMRPVDLSDREPPVILLPAEGWNRATDKALGLALRLSPDVIGLHLTALQGPDADEHIATLKRRWRRCVEQPAKTAGLPPPRLHLIQSPFRRFLEPMLKFIGELEEEFPGRTVAVLIPEVVKRHWWQHVLHTHRAAQLRAALLQHGGPRLFVIDAPYYLESAGVDEALAAEDKELAEQPLVLADENGRPQRPGT